MNSCGIVGLAGEILAKRKETGAQQTDSPEADDGGSDAPTSRPQTRAEPGTEDHHQGREDKKVELLDPAVRAGLQGAHLSAMGSYSPRRNKPWTANPTVKRIGPIMPATAPIAWISLPLCWLDIPRFEGCCVVMRRR